MPNITPKKLLKDPLSPEVYKRRLLPERDVEPIPYSINSDRDRFVIRRSTRGPGITGRKILWIPTVDMLPHGGGAFSG